MRAAAHMSTLASVASSGESASSKTHTHRWAAAVLLVGAVSMTAACTSGAKSSDKKRTASSSAAVATGQPSTAVVSAPPAPTTPVAPPHSGDISHTVPVRPASVKPAVPLTATGDFGSSVTVHVTGIKAVTAKARGAGEVSGPGLEVTLRFDNNSGKSIDLGNVVVALADSQTAPGTPMSAPPAHPFSGQLAAGSQASGVYVFAVPKADRKPITLRVSYTSAAPAVVFVGNAP
jgi:hypothetical protein